jgi:hypothetical protein
MVKDLSFSDYANLLQQTTLRQRIKIEILRLVDFSIDYEITGDVINDSTATETFALKNGARRTVTFNLQNASLTEGAGNYVPDIRNNYLAPRTPFRLFLGLADEDENIYYVLQGVFLLQDPIVISNYAESIVTITGIDSFGLYDGTLGGETEATYVIPVGTNLYTAVAGVLNVQKYPYAPLLDPQFMTVVTPYTITYATGSNLGDILVELAGINSANIFCDIQGRFVYEEDTSDLTKGSIWDFSTEENTYQGATNTYMYSLLFNSVVVIGANINNVDGDTYTATATNTDLTSNTSVGNLGYTRTKTVTDNTIATNADCLNRANYELKKSIGQECDITIPCIPVYHLDVDQVITITDPSLNYNMERFLITGFTLPFNFGGQMSITAVSAIDIIFSS